MAFGVATPVAAQNEVEILERLLLATGVSGREEHVRAAILDLLPDWVRDAAVVDAMGNLVVPVDSYVTSDSALEDPRVGLHELRYSHTAIEVIDTTDLEGLVDLLEAVARDAAWVR